MFWRFITEAGMRNLLGIALGVFIGLLASGLILLLAQPPRGEPITLLPPPTPGPLAVYVSGAVTAPGLYTLPQGCRIQQAIEAAGGLQADADLRGVNLAAALADGDQVEIPIIRPTSLPLPETRLGQVPSAGESLSFPTTGNPININTATQAELESLPGIGPVLAGQIVAFRDANGAFKRIEDIVDVPGIGVKTFEKIKDLIVV